MLNEECEARVLRTGLFINFFAEMALSAKQTFDRRPDTREIIEKETSEAEARATPKITGTSERYT